MDTIDTFLRRLPAQTDEQAAYLAGYDCGKVGANTTNCAFGLFSSREKTRAWERGKADADAGRPQKP